MARKPFPWGVLFLRLVIAAALVFVTYNPEGYSYYHWVFSKPLSVDPPKVLAGIALLIAWTIFISATFRALGAFGLLLAAAFCGTLIWTLLYYDFITVSSPRTMTYLLLTALCVVLAIGSIWSHIWFRFSGQRDVDDVED